ncbi:MAG TPA: SDR family NAD(P)-dependent oxidoreductase [Geobacterales bacterium]|nr:SDR family NAD(P)-dependent oxidoreductase [Geobacterales bacterium]
MDIKLNNKVAIVTGSAMGIGKEISRSLAKAGANVVLFDLSDMVFELSKEIEGYGIKALAIKGDVSKKTDVDDAMHEVIKSFGKIDILVNNAGIYPFKPFIEMEERDWDRVIDVNLKGTFLFTKAAVPHMISQKFGRIINIASIAGAVVGWPNLAHYCASKAAILGFTRGVSLELAPYHITVNAIAPGPIETPGTQVTQAQLEMIVKAIPVGRIGRPSDIANMVLFLCSDEASFITGQLFVVDGGYTVP